jgi:peroxiredoxin
MKRHSARTPWIVLLLVLTATAYTYAKRQPAPVWELKDMAGRTVKLSDFKGKVILLDFWATWCPPCREEIPGLIELQKKFGDRGLVVIGVSLDDGGVDVVKPFINKLGINYPVLMGTEEVARKYGDIQAIPTTFIIDRAGNIAAGHEGLTDKATFESEIKPLL